MALFDNKAAVVTGGAQGIGGATARRLAAEGAKVLIADIDDEAAAENVERVRGAGGVAEAIHADVAVSEHVKSMVDRAVQEWGRLDILVQNAYQGGPDMKGSAVAVEESAWDRGMAVLAKALYLGAKYAVPEMVKAGGGSIVNIASVHSYLMIRNNLVYESGKPAVVGMTRQMAIDFGPEGIRVNAICPGLILNERSQAQLAANPSRLRFFESQYPVGRVGYPDDIANAVAFLCSEDASFITGHPLVVDGGLSIQLQDDFGNMQARLSRENPEWDVP